MTQKTDDLFKKENFRPHALRYLRERKANMTVVELAQKIGVAPDTVYKWENRKRTDYIPKLENMKRLCKVLDCEMVDLYTDFKPEMLGEVLDDMIELIVADFNENIKSDKAGLKNIAVKEYELLKNIQREQELRASQEGQSSESENIDVRLHQMRYPSKDKPDDDDTQD